MEYIGLSITYSDIVERDFTQRDCMQRAQRDCTQRAQRDCTQRAQRDFTQRAQRDFTQRAQRKTLKALAYFAHTLRTLREKKLFA